ncbi:hypothetical protein SK87_00036 [Escherichia coli]|nr:hypothetical protein SK87_00036 [Escherichia coli]
MNMMRIFYIGLSGVGMMLDLPLYFQTPVIT